MNKSIRRVLIGVSLFITSTTWASNIHQIELGDIHQGVVHVRYNGQDQDQNKKIKLLIQKEKDQYSYNLKSNGEYETFALQLGNGEYEISIYENIVDNKYRLIETKTVDLNLEDNEKVFLNSIQNISWDIDSRVISIATALTQDIDNDIDKVSTVYQYFVNGYTYDRDKLNNIPINYLPDSKKLLLEKKGICYDFASMFAAMLRSQGIPTKLVMGYHPEIDVYHSWNEVYDKEQESWRIVDITYDLSSKERIELMPMIKDDTLYEKVKEY